MGAAMVAVPLASAGAASASAVSAGTVSVSSDQKPQKPGHPADPKEREKFSSAVGCQTRATCSPSRARSPASSASRRAASGSCT
ncbi:hypothetical protein NKH77_28545 [Streptomyces sp. M19]